MRYYGLNSRLKKDKRQYAFLLDNGAVDVLRQLRGMKKGSATGYFWNRTYKK